MWVTINEGSQIESVVNLYVCGEISTIDLTDKYEICYFVSGREITEYFSDKEERDIKYDWMKSCINADRKYERDKVPKCNLEEWKDISGYNKKKAMGEFRRFADVDIKELELSVRTYNCLNRSGIHTLCDLMAYDKGHKHGLNEIRNMGLKSIVELKKLLKEKYNLELSTIPTI